MGNFAENLNLGNRFRPPPPPPPFGKARILTFRLALNRASAVKLTCEDWI